jgi:hypothetical protein
MIVDLQLRVSLFCEMLMPHVLETVSSALPADVSALVASSLALYGDGWAKRGPEAQVELRTSSGTTTTLAVPSMVFHLPFGSFAEVFGLELALTLDADAGGAVSVTARITNYDALQDAIKQLTGHPLTGLSQEVTVPLSVGSLVSKLGFPPGTPVMNAGISLAGHAGSVDHADVAVIRLAVGAPGDLAEWTSFFVEEPASWVDVGHKTGRQLDRDWALVIPGEVILPTLRDTATTVLGGELAKQGGSIDGPVAVGWNVPTGGRFLGGPDKDWPLSPVTHDVAVYCKAKVSMLGEPAPDEKINAFSTLDAEIFVGISLSSGAPHTIAYGYYGHAEVHLPFVLGIAKMFGGPILMGLGDGQSVGGQGAIDFPDLVFQGCRMVVDEAHTLDTSLVLAGSASIHAVTRFPALKCTADDFGYAFDDLCSATGQHQGASLLLEDDDSILQGDQLALPLVATLAAVTPLPAGLEITPSIGSTFQCPAVIELRLPTDVASDIEQLTVKITSNGGPTEITFHVLGPPTAEERADLTASAKSMCERLHRRLVAVERGWNEPEPDPVDFVSRRFQEVFVALEAPASGAPTLLRGTQVVTTSLAGRRAEVPAPAIEGRFVRVVTSSVGPSEQRRFAYTHANVAMLRRLLAPSFARLARAGREPRLRGKI